MTRLSDQLGLRTEKGSVVLLQSNRTYFNFRSLRGRLAFVLVLAAIFPIVVIGFISYRWIYTVQTQKIDQDLQNSVIWQKEELERKIEEMERVSQLLDIEGGIGRDVVRFLDSTVPYERSTLYRNISSSMANVNFSNPNLGAMFFYSPDSSQKVMFPNSPDLAGFQPERLKLLFQQRNFSYYGPYRTLTRTDNNLVFSLIRKLENSPRPPLYVYIEIKVVGFSDQFADTSGRSPGDDLYYTLMNDHGELLFSNLPESSSVTITEAHPLPAGYKAFEAEGQHGWKLYQFVPMKNYKHEINKWISQFILFSFLSLLFGVSLAWGVWRMVYRPLRMVNHEILNFRQQRVAEPFTDTGLVEFNHILSNITEMRNRIHELITDVEEKEKRRGKLEVEKLLVQINPHFLHNTLNTIQWLARMQGQTNIARLVTIFTRVLHYNLGKQNIIVELRAEIAALKDYIELQNIRYDHIFNVDIQVPEELLDIQVPRFILQPLVENALYHAFNQDEGEISVLAVLEDSDTLMIEVRDNGSGIPAEKLGEMLSEERIDQGSGLGIGLRYVRKMLEVYYGESAEWIVESYPGAGTSIVMKLPTVIREERVQND
ncbi:sensor histidine kinase [Paenibacillus sp. GCM10012306]|uniref:sensor histidine kinase n=1 Tax=Paenibacillus sp. GCM10012306 TaxID=3317342 RepID=UPI00361EE312